MNGLREQATVQFPQQQTERRQWGGPVLPSAPVDLPFGGDYADLKVIYNLDNVMALEEKRDELLHAEMLESRRVTRADEADMLSHRNTWLKQVDNPFYDAQKPNSPPLIWLPREYTDEYEQATAARELAFHGHMEELRVLREAMEDRVLAFAVLQFSGPFTTPLPSPREPQECRIMFSPSVISWLVSEETLTGVADQVKSPKSRTR